MRSLSAPSQDRLAFALLTLLVVAAFANVVFGGKSLVPSENWNPLDPRVIDSEEFARRKLYTFPNIRDPVAANMQMEPAQEFFRRSVLRGEFPFWDPFVGGGSPSFASLVPAHLFPPSLLVHLMGGGSLVRNLYILALIFCAGGFTYLLLRRCGLGWQASLTGAVAFMFSGAVIPTAPSAIGQPIAFFSLALLVTARLVDVPTMRRAAEMALVFAFIALASFPPALVQIFGCCLVYVVVALFAAGREHRRPIAAWFAAGVFVSLAIVSVVYLPAFAVMAETSHVRELYKVAAESVMHPRWILQLLSPAIMGGSLIYSPPLFVPDASPTGHMYYTGVVALLLGGVGLLAGTPDRARVLKITVTICGVLALAKVFGIPPVDWIKHVPLLRTIHYAAYFGILVVYATAILAAFGIEALISGRARRCQILASGALLAAALVAVRVFAHRRGIPLHDEGWRWIADYRLLVLFSGLAFAFALFSRHRWASVLMMAVLGIEGITNSAYPRPPRFNAWEHPPRYVEVLDEMGASGRVLPLPVYPANTQSVFRHMTIDSLLPFNSSRMHAFYHRYFSPEPDLFLRHTRRLPEERILDLANVETIAVSAADENVAVEALRRSHQIVYADDYVRLLRRQSTPRYTFTTEYRVVSPEAALAQLPSLPANMVLLEETPSFASRPSGKGNVRVTKFSLNEVTLAVDAPAAGLVGCSESNMNGWRASVDGRPARILAANYAFRAIEVPRGSHVVRLRYHPPAFRVALAISVAGLILCLIGFRRATG